MKFALCNEMFGAGSLDSGLEVARELGFAGIEFAPFTFAPGADPFDVTEVPASLRSEVAARMDDLGLETVGIHWLLAKTRGLYLTSPEADVQQRTARYLGELAQLCGDLGGRIMVLGSPLQRNLLPGVSHDRAMEYAAEVLRAAMPRCGDLGVTIAVEPLGPGEGDFLNTAQSGVRLMQMVDSPQCRLHLDVKAMSTEETPIPDLIRTHHAVLAHFHANDPNLLGPGMGDVDFAPIYAALKEVDYNGWVSVEVFKYEPSPREIARQSIENLVAGLG